MTVYVVNKYKPLSNQGDMTSVYCGRGSALGNPFPVNATNTRDQACDKYDIHFDHPNEGMIRQLGYIQAAAQAGDVALVCFCAPKRCHCDTIKRHIDEVVS